MSRLRRAALVFAVMVAACGNGGDRPTRVVTTSASTTAPTTTTTEAPRRVAIRASRGRAYRPGVPTDLAFWHRLSNCEAGGRADAVSRSGKYHGAFQFSMTSWAAAGGQGQPEAQSWDYQQQIAYGWALRTDPFGQWPVCWRRAL